MEFQSTSNMQLRSRASTESDQRNLFDSANAFSIRVTQVFHGPVQLTVASEEVPFHIKKGRGALEVVVRDPEEDQHTIVVEFAHIRQITLKRQEIRSPSVAIACHLTEFAGKKLASVLQNKEEILRYETTKASYSYLNRQLVLILKPLDTKKNWMCFKLSSAIYHPISQLENMLQNWVYKLGRQQAGLHDTNLDIPASFEVVLLDSWLNYLSIISVVLKPYSTPKGKVDQYYTVDLEKNEIEQPEAQPQQNRISTRNMLRQAEQVAQKAPPKQKKQQINDATSSTRQGPLAQSEDSKKAKRPALPELKATNESPPKKKITMISTEQKQTDHRIEVQDEEPSEDRTKSTGSSATKSSNPVESPKIPLPASKKAGNVVKETLIKKKKKTPECVSLELDDAEENEPKQGTSTVEEKNNLKIKEKSKFSADTKLVNYPAIGSRTMPQATVTFNDMKYLAHQEMINDNIIDFYLKYILCELINEERRNKIHIFNTFFYPNITGFTNGKSNNPKMAYQRGQRAGQIRYQWVKDNYSRVKNWTRKVNLFEKDFIVVPIHDELHWYIVIIVNPAKAIVQQRKEDLTASREKGATRPNPDSYVVVLDSWKDEHDARRLCIVDLIRDYLEIEFDDKKPMEGVLERTRLAPLYPCHLPIQTNFVDCGIYLLEFAELFLTKPPEIGPSMKNCWNVWYPNTYYRLAYKRERITNKLKQLAGEEIWNQLKLFEKENDRGVTVETLESAVEKSRRKRNLSETRSREFVKMRTRGVSAPPDGIKAGPTQKKNCFCKRQKWQV